MADTFNIFPVFNGTKRLALHIVGATSDGSNTAITISAATYAATSFTINKITWTLSAVGFTLHEKASSNYLVFSANSGVAATNQGSFNFTEYGGIENSKQSGNNGDLVITPTANANGDSFSIFIELTKNY